MTTWHLREVKSLATVGISERMEAESWRWTGWLAGWSVPTAERVRHQTLGFAAGRTMARIRSRSSHIGIGLTGASRTAGLV